ncbi:helix-turn-helix domain-containing protein [Mycobacterium marinum]|uniref:helix-turn-helix domain-containing protein n=1 Tax=Mycobacterium marinum TaxID=1781 RepID=UPI00235A345F|nr:helix-turn-helix domain-containing protein [Mycobacterium marinum]MDC8985571.1 helix-turn-helix domain-containing protein [Mycobacterium marinum]MDC9002860.1 helix-turn-helix domain-containing protein [Mycobacterium marinum]MDC9013596.1 helix-turn-helix domain-containing protein [Mycobacterium marinum]MDC9018957.1 helix-turn-helix domain-containing protein [Mycobacterium marinum]
MISPRFLSGAERIEIADGHQTGETVRAIAAGIRRSPSTVDRELRRNSTKLRRGRPRRRQRRRRPGHIHRSTRSRRCHNRPVAAGPAAPGNRLRQQGANGVCTADRGWANPDRA